MGIQFALTDGEAESHKGRSETKYNNNIRKEIKI